MLTCLCMQPLSPCLRMRGQGLLWQRSSLSCATSALCRSTIGRCTLCGTHCQTLSVSWTSFHRSSQFPQINQILLRPCARPGRPSWMENTTLLRTNNYSGVPLTFSPRQTWSNYPALIRGDFFRNRLVPGIVAVTFRGKTATEDPWQQQVPRVDNPDVMHMLTGLSMYGVPDMPRVATHMNTHQENCSFFKRFLT